MQFSYYFYFPKSLHFWATVSNRVKVLEEIEKMKIIKRVKMKKIKETVREELENFKTEKNKKRRIEI